MKLLKLYWQNYISAYKGLSQATWLLAMVMFINQSGSMVLPFLGVYMATVLNFSLQNAGIVLSMFGIGSIAGSFVGGWLTDKFGSFKIQTFSLFFSIPFYIIVPYFKTFETLCIAILFLSFIKELFRPANSASVSFYAKPENLTRAFSLNRMALNLGYSIGPAIGGFLAAVSYNFLFYANACMSFVAGILFVFYFKNRKGNAPFKELNSTIQVPIKEKSAYSDRIFLIFSVFIAIYAFCFFQILNTLPLFYKNVAMMTEKEVGLLMGFNGIVVFVLEMALVHFAEKKFTLTTNMIIGSLFCGAAFVVLIPTHVQFILYASIFLISISEILIMPFASTVAVNRSKPTNRGSYMGLNGISFSLAFVSSPLIGTYIAQNFGFTNLWIFNCIMIVFTSVGFYFIMKKI
ncbi:MFS transporter [Myroides sp. JBRI-B21084]|uniref:MFS transporter n=1 Tax=Myroides sp. JBRI-B21084 TaxID=3119977 RepID=UPI0026E2D675|nr:MFS transporter [Paenimyroides cloacae]WKW45418.1 MFS transporter [Paenimyroides cloacae]